MRLNPNSPNSQALAAGLSLLAMAIIAPLATMAALPARHYAAAAVGVFIVAALDVVAALALARLLYSGGRALNYTAAALRVVYAGIFAVAACFLFIPNVTRFQSIWDHALLLFALHLMLLGLVGWRSCVLPRWIAVLVGLAGATYAADALMLIFTGRPGSFAKVGFIGEVVLMVWLLWRASSRRAARE